MTTPDLNTGIADWRSGALSPRAAEAVFDGLPAVEPDALIGAWRGEALPTRHPLDRLLADLGWWGKRFHDLDRVDPLLFERRGAIHAVDPRRLPRDLVLRPPRLASSPVARLAFGALLPLLSTDAPRARLRPVSRAGVASAAMIYDDLPVIDHFRSVDADRVLGLMDQRNSLAPFFFLLTRTTDLSPSRPG